MAAADTAIPQAKRKIHGRVRVTLDIVCHKPKSTKLITPRGDIDNYMKAILDAVTKKGYWHDDAQVAEINAVKRYAMEHEEPHTNIEIYPL